jgi:hypothetical protein
MTPLRVLHLLHDSLTRREAREGGPCAERLTLPLRLRQKANGLLLRQAAARAGYNDDLSCDVTVQRHFVFVSLISCRPNVP